MHIRAMALGLTTVFAVALVFAGESGSVSPVGATGTGGAISFGLVSGTTVSVNTTETIDPYGSFNLHVSAKLSPGVQLASIVGNDAAPSQGTLSSLGQTFCASFTPATWEEVFGCTAFVGQTTTASGVLATMSFNATGDGCIVTTLLTGFTDSYPPRPSAALNTYTMNSADSTEQSVIVSTATAEIMVGAGVQADCLVATGPPTPPATPIGLSFCPPKISGLYSGAYELAPGEEFPFSLTLVFSANQISGTSYVPGAPTFSGPVTGVVHCGDISEMTFNGQPMWSVTISEDGATLSGLYGNVPWTVTVEGGGQDSDVDGFNNALEQALVKDSDTYCSVMRADVDYDGAVSILDLSAVAQHFDRPAPARADQDADGVISILDLAHQATDFQHSVMLCP